MQQQQKIQATFRGMRNKKGLANKKRKTGVNLPSNRTKKMKNIKIDINSDIFTTLTDGTIEIISKPKDSASNSIVVKIKDIHNNSYILKISLNHRNQDSGYETEKENYKTMKKILENRLTPHIYSYIDSKVVNFKSLDRSTKLYNIVKENSGNNNPINTIKSLDILLTETSDSKEVITLWDFIYKFITLNKVKFNLIIYNLLFQIFYTLHIFNNLKIKHNDLHFGNILVIISEQNITNDRFEVVYNNVYTYNNKTVHLPNIGLSIRIFDFDRTTKATNDEYGKKTCNIPISRDFPKTQNCNINPFFDTYKVLYHLYKIVPILKKINNTVITDWIEKLFKDKSYITNPSSKKKYLNDEYGFLFNNVDATMMPTIKILNNLVDNPEYIPETYTIRFNEIFEYRNTKRPISGQYHENGINHIIQQDIGVKHGTQCYAKGQIAIPKIDNINYNYKPLICKKVSRYMVKN